jgi:hypothetical protein
MDDLIVPSRGFRERLGLPLVSTKELLLSLTPSGPAAFLRPTDLLLDPAGLSSRPTLRPRAGPTLLTSVVEAGLCFSLLSE